MKYLNGMIVIILFFYVSIQKVNALSACTSFTDSIIVESVNFYTVDSLSLCGKLYLPSKSPEKIIIYIGRPEEPFPVFDFINNKDTTALLRNVVENMIKVDIGVLFFSMRVPYDYNNQMKIITSSEYRAQTLETLAEDAQAACSFIKQDIRFKNTPVGVAGVSAIGRSATIAAAQEKGISFVVILSTPSTDSFDDAEYQYDRGTLNYMHLRGYFSALWSMVKDTTFTYEGVKYVNSKQKSIEDKFIACAWDCFKKINRTIIAKYSDYNTIQQKAATLMKRSFQWGKSGDWTKLKESNAENPDELIDFIIWNWYKPIDVSFLKWNPEEWYPQLECPTLFLFAGNDKIIDIKGSIANIRRIKEQYNKQNFIINVVKGCGHSFEYYYIRNEKGKAVRCRSVSKEVCSELSNWLDTICN